MHKPRSVNHNTYLVSVWEYVSLCVFSREYFITFLGKHSAKISVCLWGFVSTGWHWQMHTQGLSNAQMRICTHTSSFVLKRSNSVNLCKQIYKWEFRLLSRNIQVRVYFFHLAKPYLHLWTLKNMQIIIFCFLMMPISTHNY